MAQRHKTKKQLIWRQGVASIIFILSLISVQSPHAEAISAEIQTQPARTGMTSTLTEGTRETCTTVSLTAVADTMIVQSQPDEPYGDEDTIRINGDSTNLRGGLFRWDVSSIPNDATIQSASLSFFVSGGSDHTFGLYNLKRAWI